MQVFGKRALTAGIGMTLLGMGLMTAGSMLMSADTVQARELPPSKKTIFNPPPPDLKGINDLRKHVSRPGRNGNDGRPRPRPRITTPDGTTVDIILFGENGRGRY